MYIAYIIYYTLFITYINIYFIYTHHIYIHVWCVCVFSELKDLGV